ncbi:MAG: PhoU domain-containing protein [Candidatus Thermoplasmatota archaeon]|nr:PhoU domain-containing protein [Candidatus Thermoplasmatota archaeon]
MFKNIWDALKKNPLIDESYEIMDELHDQTRKMFTIAMKALMDQNADPEKVIKMDKEVNMNVQRIRRSVFEYFSLSSVPNIHGGLILISLVIDYERIGDYAKELANIREEYDFRESFQPDNRKELHMMEDLIIEMGPEAHDSFMSPVQKYPTPVTGLEIKLKEHYDNLRELTLKKNIQRDEALTVITSARLMKRIAGHLDNIASSAARPFPKLGFKPGASTWEDQTPH